MSLKAPRRAGACVEGEGIVVGTTPRLGERDATVLVGQVFRAGKGWGALEGGVVACRGAEVWHQSDGDNEDMGDMGGGGWGATRWVRAATAEEAAPVIAREAERVAKAEAAKAAVVSEQVTYAAALESAVAGLAESSCGPADHSAGLVMGAEIARDNTGWFKRRATAAAVRETGEQVVVVEATGHDDWRVSYWASPATVRAWALAYAARVGITVAKAQEYYAAGYGGCSGSDVYAAVLVEAGIDPAGIQEAKA